MAKYASNTAATEDRAAAMRLGELLDVVGVRLVPSAERNARFLPVVSPNCCASSTSGLRALICALSIGLPFSSGVASA